MPWQFVGARAHSTNTYVPALREVCVRTTLTARSRGSLNDIFRTRFLPHRRSFEHVVSDTGERDYAMNEILAQQNFSQNI
eukprot:2677390-Pyramimonas_sp.AAC.1